MTMSIVKDLYSCTGLATVFALGWGFMVPLELQQLSVFPNVCPGFIGSVLRRATTRPCDGEIRPDWHAYSSFETALRCLSWRFPRVLRRKMTYREECHRENKERD